VKASAATCPSSDVISPLEKSIKPGLKSRLEGDRPWQIVAGRKMPPDQLWAATVRDGGEHRRIEAKNRAMLKAAEEAEIDANGYFADPDWREVISPDGIQCFVTRFRDVGAPAPAKTMPPIPDDLSIPAFLDRRTTGQELAEAA
jgi:hypothetical protein